MKNSIYVTSQDRQRLQDLLAATAASGPRQQGDWKELAEEWRRAEIVSSRIWDGGCVSSLLGRFDTTGDKDHHDPRGSALP